MPEWRRVAGWAGLILFFTLTAIWSVWPAPKFPYQLLPTARSVSATVPIFNAWTIWWNADRFMHGWAGYWNAPIFWPEKGTFAFSDPQPATCLVAPIVWLTGSPIPAYHIYLVGSFVLNGVFAVRLLRVLRVGWISAIAGGTAMLLHPLVHQQGDVLQLMPLWGILWTLEALFRLHRRPSLWQGVQLGVAFASVFMISIHQGVLLTLLLAATVWLTIPLAHWKPWLLGGTCAIATSSVLLLPLLWPMQRILTEHAFRRDASMIRSLSATTSDWLHVSPTAWLQTPVGKQRANYHLSPGWLRTTLAFVGALFLFVQRSRPRQPVAFLIALGGCAFLGSFGLNLKIGAWQPWLTLSELFPVISHIRSVFRFAYFVQLAVIVMSAIGLHFMVRYLGLKLKHIHKKKGIAGRKEKWEWLSVGSLVTCAVVIAFEVPPARVLLASVPDVTVEPAWVIYLREHTTAGRSVLCLPFAAGYSPRDFEQTTRWMLYGTRHRAPLVNGYSGFFPESWYRMVEALTHDPKGDATLKKLADIGVEFIVILPNTRPELRVEGRGPKAAQLVRVFHDDSGVEIWRLIDPSLNPQP